MVPAVVEGFGDGFSFGTEPATFPIRGAVSGVPTVLLAVDIGVVPTHEVRHRLPDGGTPVVPLLFAEIPHRTPDLVNPRRPSKVAQR